MSPTSDLPSIEKEMETASEMEWNHCGKEMTGSREERPTQSPLYLIPLLLVMMQQLKAESDRKTMEIDRLKNEKDKLSDELERSKKTKTTFPLLSLPDELIGHIFSFLTIKERMGARVCKRLDEVEKAYKYYVPRCLIQERATPDPNRFNNNFIRDHKQYFILLHEKVYSTDFLKRIVQNARFGYLQVALHCLVPWSSHPGALIMNPKKDLHRDIFNLIKKCSIEELVLRLKSPPWEESTGHEAINDSYLSDIMNTCTKLVLDNIYNITGNGFLNVYQAIGRSAKLRSLDITYIRTEMLKSFLQLIGIKSEDEKYMYSTRSIQIYNRTEVIKMNDDDEDDDEDAVIRLHQHIFDGNLEIVVEHQSSVEGTLKMEYHETREELEKAKNVKGCTRIEVLPE